MKKLLLLLISTLFLLPLLGSTPMGHAQTVPIGFNLPYSPDTYQYDAVTANMLWPVSSNQAGHTRNINTAGSSNLSTTTFQSIDQYATVPACSSNCGTYVVRCTGGVNTSCNGNTEYGCSGTITSNTAGSYPNGPIYTVSACMVSGTPHAFQANDLIITDQPNGAGQLSYLSGCQYSGSFSVDQTSANMPPAIAGYKPAQAVTVTLPPVSNATITCFLDGTSTPNLSLQGQYTMSALVSAISGGYSGVDIAFSLYRNSGITVMSGVSVNLTQNAWATVTTPASATANETSFPGNNNVVAYFNIQNFSSNTVVLDLLGYGATQVAHTNASPLNDNVVNWFKASKAPLRFNNILSGWATAGSLDELLTPSIYRPAPNGADQSGFTYSSGNPLGFHDLFQACAVINTNYCMISIPPSWGSTDYYNFVDYTAKPGVSAVSSNGNTTISGFASTTGINVGDRVYGPGISSSTLTTVATVSTNSITVATAPGAGAGSGTFYTGYAAVRAALGQPTPWTQVFKHIELEIGNELWNYSGATSGSVVQPYASIFPLTAQACGWLKANANWAGSGASAGVLRCAVTGKQYNTDNITNVLAANTSGQIDDVSASLYTQNTCASDLTPGGLLKSGVTEVYANTVDNTLPIYTTYSGAAANSLGVVVYESSPGLSFGNSCGQTNVNGWPEGVGSGILRPYYFAALQHKWPGTMKQAYHFDSENRTLTTANSSQGAVGTVTAQTGGVPTAVSVVCTGGCGGYFIGPNVSTVATSGAGTGLTVNITNANIYGQIQAGGISIATAGTSWTTGETFNIGGIPTTVTEAAYGGTPSFGGNYAFYNRPYVLGMTMWNPCAALGTDTGTNDVTSSIPTYSPTASNGIGAYSNVPNVVAYKYTDGAGNYCEAVWNFQSTSYSLTMSGSTSPASAASIAVQTLNSANLTDGNETSPNNVAIVTTSARNVSLDMIPAYTFRTYAYTLGGSSPSNKRWRYGVMGGGSSIY